MNLINKIKNLLYSLEILVELELSLSNNVIYSPEKVSEELKRYSDLNEVFGNLKEE